MDKQFFWDILDQKRINILPLFKDFKEDFYLAGGTALALQLGHRDSIDFDFFSENSFSIKDLTQKAEKIFQNHKVAKIQEEKDTLTFVIDDNIKISFFAFAYQLIKPLLDEDNFKMASLEDIGAMKLSAITSRSVLKDYIDLYFILHKISLGELFKLTKEKFPTIDINLILKSLVYFDDIQEEPILFKHEGDISFESVKKYLSETVTKYLVKADK
jgi:hypothetical protein